MRSRDLPNKTTETLWRMAGDEGITLREAGKRLLDERLEHERLERERSRGKIVFEIRLDGVPHVVALSKKTLRVLWREAGKASLTIDELVETWLEQRFTPHVQK